MHGGAGMGETAVTSDRIVEDIMRFPAALDAIIAARAGARRGQRRGRTSPSASKRSRRISTN